MLISPQATVHGVDVFPPPNSWVPPNCFLEVEDVTKEWTWRQKFDLINMRYMVRILRAGTFQMPETCTNPITHVRVGWSFYGPGVGGFVQTGSK